MTVVLEMCIYFDLAILFVGVYPKETLREFFLKMRATLSAYIQDNLLSF